MKKVSIILAGIFAATMLHAATNIYVVNMSEVYSNYYKAKEAAARDMAEAEDILGDFVVYPTLFVKTDDGELHAVARGYAPFEEVEAKIEDALGRGASLDTVSADACGLDGSCCR